MDRFVLNNFGPIDTAYDPNHSDIRNGASHSLLAVIRCLLMVRLSAESA